MHLLCPHAAGTSCDHDDGHRDSPAVSLDDVINSMDESASFVDPETGEVELITFEELHLAEDDDVDGALLPLSRFGRSDAPSGQR